MPLTVEESYRVGPVLVLGVTGRLVLGEATEKLDAVLQRLIARGERALLLDCAGIPAIDSEGIRALVHNVVSLQNRGGHLKLMKLTPQVRWTLEVARLLSVIESFDDEDTALRSMARAVGGQP